MLINDGQESFAASVLKNEECGSDDDVDGDIGVEKGPAMYNSPRSVASFASEHAFGLILDEKKGLREASLLTQQKYGFSISKSTITTAVSIIIIFIYIIIITIIEK